MWQLFYVNYLELDNFRQAIFLLIKGFDKHGGSVCQAFTQTAGCKITNLLKNYNNMRFHLKSKSYIVTKSISATLAFSINRPKLCNTTKRAKTDL